MFDEFYRWAEQQSRTKLLALQTNNALEFRKIGQRLAELGINQRMSAPYSHQQMGHVKRRHRHLIDTTIMMINHAKLPPSMWDFRVLVACYLYNRNPTPILQGRSPLEVLFRRTLEYMKLRVFGCKCFLCLFPYQANKLDVMSVPCVFIGYSIQQDSYLCLDSGNHWILIYVLIWTAIGFSLRVMLVLTKMTSL